MQCTRFWTAKGSNLFPHVNVPLYASDRHSDRYKAASRFLEAWSASPEVLCLAWPTLMSYLRISTHPAIFTDPLTHDEACNNVAALLALPNVRPLAEMDGFMEAYGHVAGGVVVRGNLVPDVHLAAILFQHGVRLLYSTDRDFRKFDALEVRDPFSSGH